MPKDLTARTLRILAIDGGGVRGIIPARVLDVIEQKTGQPIAKQFDLIVGVSTGGVLALGLNVPDEIGWPQYTASEICDLYMDNAREIFSKPYRSYIPFYDYFTDKAASKYSIKGMQKVLGRYFKDMNISQSITPSLLLSYDIQKTKPRMFSSLHAQKEKHAQYFTKDAVEASAHAQTYFTMGKTKNANGDFFYLLDGGNVANNPSLHAISFGKRFFKNADNVLLYGYGGEASWAADTVDIAMNSASDLVENIANRFIDYDEGLIFRFEPKIKDEDQKRMDNSEEKNLKILLGIADAMISSTHKTNISNVVAALIKIGEERNRMKPELLPCVNDTAVEESLKVSDKQDIGIHFYVAKDFPDFKKDLIKFFQECGLSRLESEWALKNAFMNGSDELYRNKLSISGNTEGNDFKKEILTYTDLLGQSKQVAWTEFAFIIRAMRKEMKNNCDFYHQNIDFFADSFTSFKERSPQNDEKPSGEL